MYISNRAIQQLFHKQLCNYNDVWVHTTKFNNNTTVNLQWFIRFYLPTNLL